MLVVINRKNRALFGLTTNALAIAAGLLFACGSDTSGGDKAGAGGDGGAGTPGFTTGGDFADLDTFVEDGAPEDAPSLFEKVGESADDAAPGPCLLEPQAKTLYPKNWVAPRFKWVAPSSAANLYELRVTAKNQTKDLIVYTTGSTWTMPKAMWDALREHSADQPMTVSIRAATYQDGELTDVTANDGGELGIAPVEAPGSIVFWSIKGEEESLLKGFTVGEEGLANVLRREDMPANNKDGRQCMGCHVSTPDGKGVAVSWETVGSGEFDGYAPDVAQIEKGTKAGPRPTFMTENATGALNASKIGMFSAFSRGHWKTGDRIALTNNATDLVWIDLEAKSATGATGVLGRKGDTTNKRRMGPTWSRDGNSIVYMSGELGVNPAELRGPIDLYIMPYNNKAGATDASPATKIAGASDPAISEYYPALSPDDQWVAFNTLKDNGVIYDNANAELFVIPTKGGNKIRLSANDPPACSGKSSPGITNSWPKWAPEVQERNGKRYYWVVFSSRRHDKTQKPQLYVAPVVVDSSSGEVTTYPAMYFRNQESIQQWESWGNHTPAWDVFEIEPAVVK
jgi:hypothetical protein